MKIYITGKVSGTPISECTMKFGAAQQQLQQLGHDPINPLAVVNDWHTPWAAAMRTCITALMTADAVFALPDSYLSNGGLIELELANELGIPVYTELSKIPKP